MRKSLLTLAVFSVAFGQEVSFREEVNKLGYYFYLDVSPTQTLLVKTGHISGIIPKEAIALCSALGGKAYVINTKIVEGFGGRREVQEKVPAETYTGFKGLFKDLGRDIYTYTCEKDEQMIFKVSKVSYIGLYYTGNPGYSCYVHFIDHLPDKEMSFFDHLEREKVLKANSLIEFWRAVGLKPKQLPDGSYKLEGIGIRCSPFHANPPLMYAISYCNAKGGVLKTENGQDVKRFLVDVIDKDWLTHMGKKTYYCDGPEKFTISASMKPTNIASQVQFLIYYKQGIDLPTKAQGTQGQSQGQSIIGQLIPGAAISSQEIIASGVLTTARTRKPTVNSVGSMQYQTVYLLPEGQCHLVASIAKGPGYTQVENYRVCGERIESLGKSDDYRALTVSRLAQDVGFSRNFYSTCRSYGEIVSSYQGYQVVCRAVNPNQPCFAEVLLLRDKKLVDVELGMDICTNIR